MKRVRSKRVIAALFAVAAAVGGFETWSSWSAAQSKPAAGPCDGLPDYGKLKSELTRILRQGQAVNTGLGNDEWAVVVNRDGLVCAVVFSGADRGAQWPGSRLIAAEKANTANALSKPDFALSTANVWAPAQPGQSLYSLATSAPPNGAVVFSGNPADYGQANDPFVGKAVGGIITFGGGLALYDDRGKLVGALGVSGDTSCADHVVAWQLRHGLGLDAVPGGVGQNASDNMVLDLQPNGSSTSGYGHPSCKGGKPSDDAIKDLPNKYPIGKKKK